MPDIKLPDLGEGIDSATVISIIASVGDVLNLEDPIIEIETDKAVIPVPASEAGKIESILVKDGDVIKTGDILLKVVGTSSVNTPAIETTKTEASSNASSASGKLIEFKLPDLGEGIEGGTVIGLILKPGDSVEEDDPVIELETDKAVIPVPAPCAGSIKDILVKDGQAVKVGDVLFTITSSSTSSASTPAVETSKPEVKPTLEKQTSTTTNSVAPPQNTNIVSSSKDVAAGPATRKLARELGVDLARVSGSARGGRITIEDLKSFVKSSMQGNSGGSLGVNLPPLPDFSKFGPIRKEKISKLRKTVAERMYSYWTIPHVHQFDEIDVTNIMELQKKYAAEFKEAGSALSLTQFIIKAMVESIKKFPMFNASFDHINDELILKDYVNIGVAVDTPSGLIVPVMKDVDKMSIFEIGKNLKEIAKKTRDRKITISDLQGAGITLSNLGGVGGTSFTPIISYPEVAIVGSSKSVIKPVFINGEFKPRHIMNICVAYDHRVIDGADGARFIKTLNSHLENIDKTLLM